MTMSSVREQILERERHNAARLVRMLRKKNVPPFTYGLEHLGLTNNGSELTTLKEFAKKWFENPDHYINFKNYKKPLITKKGWRYQFSDILDPQDRACFFESKQPLWGRGARIAFIIVPHWSPFFWKYYWGTAMIRNFFLPVATYMYFPEYGSLRRNVNEAHYDVVGPNLGLTIKRFQQDVLNIQRFGVYLKENLDYEYVGMWGYSIGSPRAFVASMFSDIFDYVIMNFLADSFPEAALNGIATQDISQEIRKYLSDEDMEEIWSPMSPGRYIPYVGRLPDHVRLIQPKYDLVFGEENNQRMVLKLKASAPNVEVEYGDFGHSTYGRGRDLAPSIYRNAQFVINNSPLRFFPFTK